MATHTTVRARGIDRVIDILDYLHAKRSPVRIGELARATQTPRSTIYEIVNRLVEARWLELRNGDGAVFFGPAMHYYGSDYLESVDLIRTARLEVTRLAEQVGETAQLCSLDGDKYIVMLNEPGRRMFRISSEIGIKVPIPWTASGRLLVDHLSPDQVREFIPGDDFRLPDGRVIQVDDFVAEVALARRAGFARTSALVDRFTTCLAAPVRDSGGRCLATICFVVPADTTAEQQETMVEILKESGRKMSIAR